MSIEEFVERTRLYKERCSLVRQLAEKDALIAEPDKEIAQLEAKLERCKR